MGNLSANKLNLSMLNICLFFYSCILRIYKFFEFLHVYSLLLDYILLCIALYFHHCHVMLPVLYVVVQRFFNDEILYVVV